MERDLRLKAFMEEYARIVQLFDDIVSMKESMGRLEKYMIIMVIQVCVALVDRGSGVNTNWSTGSNEIRRSATTKPPSTPSHERHRAPLPPPPPNYQNFPNFPTYRTSYPESLPSLVSGPSTFVRFSILSEPPSTPYDSSTSSRRSSAASHHSELENDAGNPFVAGVGNADVVVVADDDDDDTLVASPRTTSSSSPTLTTSLRSRQYRSYSSIPTIDRTISEDSMLVIKRL